MRVALGQINPVIGDFAGNVDKVLDYTARARELGAELAVFPEMCLCGYPPMDLVDQASFVEANLQGLRRLQRACPPGIGVVVGYVDRNRDQAGKPLVNAVSLLADGEILATRTKTLLPSYDVFDEARYFQPAASRQVVAFKGERLGIAICEDMWWEAEPPAGTRYPVDPVKELLDDGATLILAPSASPFYSGKPRIRLELASGIGKRSGVPVVYVNTVGANDSLIFDGQSFWSPPATAAWCSWARPSGSSSRWWTPPPGTVAEPARRPLRGAGPGAGAGHRRLPGQVRLPARAPGAVRGHRLRPGGGARRPGGGAGAGHRVRAALPLFLGRAACATRRRWPPTWASAWSGCPSSRRSGPAWRA